jgi:hypothetical protein
MLQDALAVEAKIEQRRDDILAQQAKATANTDYSAARAGGSVSLGVRGAIERRSRPGSNEPWAGRPPLVASAAARCPWEYQPTQGRHT